MVLISVTPIEKNTQHIERILRLGSLYAKIPARSALFIELILKTGATPSDLIGIIPKDFNEKNHTFTLRVNKKKEILPQTHKLSAAAFKAAQNVGFSNISKRRIQQLIKVATTQLHAPCTSKDLRRRYIDTALHSGGDLVNKTQLTSIYERRILSKEEEKQILSQCKGRDKALISLVLKTGIRINEALKISVEYVRKNQLIIRRKHAYNGKLRRIKITSQLSKQLLAYTSQCSISKRRFEQICQEISLELPFTFTPSDLRNTAINTLSSQLSQEELLSQSGLGSSTLYTHGIVSRVAKTTQTTSQISRENKERKDSTNDFVETSKYHKSRLRRRGGNDE